MSHSAPTVSLYLLGPPRVERGGSVAALKYNRARGLLAYLALEPGFHTRDSLAELFWPNEPTNQGRDKLKRMLFELREALGERCIEGDRYVVRLAPLSTVWVDAIAFEADTDPVIPMSAAAPAPNPGMVQGASASTTSIHAWRDALDRCARAVELYRGPLLQGLRLDDAPDFEIWLDGQREAYIRRLVLALNRLSRGRAQEGRPVDAVRHARRLVDIAPHHEPGWQLLIDLLMQNGRRDEALHELERCRRALARELDAEPQPATLALVESDIAAEQARLAKVAAGRSGLSRVASDTLPVDAPSRVSDDGRESRPESLTEPDESNASARAISPASVPRAHARLAMGVAHLVHARFAKAQLAFEATLAAQPDELVDLTFGADARAMALSLLSITQWRSGLRGPALEASDQALERARRVGDPHTHAYALVTAGVLSQLQSDFEQTLSYTSELLELVERRHLSNWRLAATALSGWAIGALGDPEGTTDAEAAAHALNATMGSVGLMLLSLLRPVKG